MWSGEQEGEAGEIYLHRGGGGAPVYTGLSVWHPPVCPEEGPQLWALMALFQVERVFPKVIELGLIKNWFSVIMLVGADAPPPAAVRLIDALRHLRGEEQSDMQVLQLNVR